MGWHVRIMRRPKLSVSFGKSTRQAIPNNPERFQEKWNPVFRPTTRQTKKARAVSVSSRCEHALAPAINLRRSRPPRLQPRLQRVAELIDDQTDHHQDDE